ncbi:hypothetical protein BDV96DRAFT_646197 [Lophiotrema nucula]|uniref:Uncharacterized protein n=1 Tax=Lophiotrema nucula TaxID=690887 RepID=A0A6A5Z9W7_9PLEO|nr:hypothetical protein BDV96DRAFT_646197 [Lophiotrema nucula]
MGELQSWMFPTNLATSGPPEVGHKAPETQKLHIGNDGEPTIVTFLRHCGCPFAEKAFLNLRDLASKHSNIRCIAVSHSDKPSTDKWLEELGGADKVEIVIDESRQTHADWGLGVSSFWHVLNPFSLYSVYTLGKKENIWNRPTESGSRWQTAGSFAADKEGIVKWSKPNASADDVPNFEEALKALS